MFGDAGNEQGHAEEAEGRFSSDRLNTTALMQLPNLMASPISMAISRPMSNGSPPISSPAIKGRYSAMTRSSVARMASTTGVPRWPVLPRSVRTLAMIPDEERCR